MVLGWLGGSKGQSLTDLIARKQYSKAVDALKAEFEKGDRSPRMRLQFADVLVMAGRLKEAFPILLALADDFARDGFAAKAIAVLKKAEKIQPSSFEVDRRLAGLIVEKSRSLTITSTGSFKAPVFDMEEIADAPAALPLVPPPPRGTPVRNPEPKPEPEPEPESEPEPELEPLPSTGEGGGESSEEFDLGQELVALIQQSVEEEQSPEPTAPPMKSIPLFGDLSEAEFIELARGFKLRSFQPGDIVITSGERGDSLFALTTGSVKAFVLNPDGKHVQVREMREGDFFGEISILTGQPRTATITAATRCELLELDRRTLDDIKKRHPRVLQVLHAFGQQRQGSAAEQRARKGQG